MNLTYKTPRAESIAISKAQAAALLAAGKGMAPDKYAHRTAWQDRMRAAMMDDAAAVRAASKGNFYGTPPKKVDDGPTVIQASVLAAVNVCTTSREVGDTTGMSSSNAGHILRALHKAGRIIRHEGKPITWSKA